MLLRNIICLFTLCIASTIQAGEKPNILFIFTDDWGWGDLSCHGHPYIKTPNIDRIAKEGTDFHRFTVASPVCSPSRAAVMTGQFPARLSINGHFAQVASNARRNMPDWLALDAPFLPRLLKAGGYATAHYGKWHLANEMITDSPVPGAYGYDHYGAFNCSGVQMPWYEDSMNAVAFMEKSKKEGRPFFINVWMHEPHTPHHVIPEYRWKFRNLEEKDSIYAAILSHADDRVGEMLDALDRLGLTDNTLVIFSSDNGPARSTSGELSLHYDPATGAGYNTGASMGVTGGRKGYKASIFEGGIGVPFLVRWPGKVAAGRVDEVSLISAVDLFPTLCEAAGLKMPEGYVSDGMNMISVLKGEQAPARKKPLFWKYPSRWPAPKSKPDHRVSYAVVDETWKLVTNKDLSHVELYDLAKDVNEQMDLKGKHPAVVKQLTEKLITWQKSLPTEPRGNVFSSLRKDTKEQ